MLDANLTFATQMFHPLFLLLPFVPNQVFQLVFVYFLPGTNNPIHRNPVATSLASQRAKVWILGIPAGTLGVWRLWWAEVAGVLRQGNPDPPRQKAYGKMSFVWQGKMIISINWYKLTWLRAKMFFHFFFVEIQVGTCRSTMIQELYIYCLPLPKKVWMGQTITRHHKGICGIGFKGIQDYI